jgi:hypothetical protein
VEQIRLRLTALAWFVLIASMAIIDALAPTTEFRVSGWLFGSYIGVVLTMNCLIANRDQAIGLSLLFIGGMLFLYNIVWQITFLATGGTFVFPVNLWPFGANASASEWYGLLGLGVLMIWFGARLAFLSDPGPKAE